MVAMTQISVFLSMAGWALLSCGQASEKKTPPNSERSADYCAEHCADYFSPPVTAPHAPACQPDTARNGTAVDTLGSTLSSSSFATAGSVRLIGVLGFDSVLASDVTAPLEVFGAARTKAWFSDYRVALIADAPQGIITTAEGFRLVVDAQLAQVPAVDVLIVPGSYEMANVIGQHSILQFVKNQRKQANWLASNCAGAFLLGAAGALDGHRATTYYGGGKSLKAEVPNAVIVDQPVVVDGRLITSNGSVVSYVSALVLLGLLSSPEHAKEIFEYLQLSRLISWDIVRNHWKQ